jgi:lambda repressor-like predicted transcriptional regulator
MTAAHGTHAGFYRHKRSGETPCEPCRVAYRRHIKAWKLERDRSGPRIVSGDAVRAHVQALLDQGMSLRSIGKFSGVSASTISNVMSRPSSGINKRNEARILALAAPVYELEPEAETFVPRVGAVRRIQALLALGWTHAHMKAECGVLTHVLLSQSGGWVTQRNHNRVAAMFERLSMTPGPSSLTRARAARAGYLPPLAWDDGTIDDPGAWADLGSDEDVAQPDEVVVDRLLSGADWRAIGATRAERIAAAERMDVLVEAGRHLGLRAGRDFTPRRRSP